MTPLCAMPILARASVADEPVLLTDQGGQETYWQYVDLQEPMQKPTDEWYIMATISNLQTGRVPLREPNRDDCDNRRSSGEIA